MGKGSTRRPAQISPEEEAKRWEEVFGKPQEGTPEGNIQKAWENRQEYERKKQVRKRCPDQWNKGSTRAYLGLP